ncbi:carboxyl-terminal protease [Chloroherpeton thalassium ATCC 35110]|uniref:Carboxyl-terminal protease n=1 Tax=Chloroherpeton thalassium (strain ATCC 35110 / GB-78) TaxID=517418 RepID=B3QWG3_CHLT3|nr:carboxy terminal-processing peptidase [Chloroherpeton thalassium]ACF14723.1 carboxyl-terminal protease [Chloroherpeton thalassium ATCC 35110]
MMYKKNFFLSFALLCLVSLSPVYPAIAQSSAQPDTTSGDIEPSAGYSRAEQIISFILEKLHYREFSFNDSLSSEIFERYLKTLDYNKTYFLESDVRAFATHRLALDDDLRAGRLDAAYEIFNVYKDRVRQRIKWAQARIDERFDFTLDERYEYKREDMKWAATETELNEVWRKLLKNQALELKLSGKQPSEIAKILKDRLANQQRRIEQYNVEDVFRLFMNSVTASIDPHTNYFSPMDSDNFKINMSLSFEGIGARLQSENEYTMVYEIIPGGPAFKAKQLAKGDKIIGVGQGENGEIQDVIGWRLDDVVKLIRGPKGTIVKLQIIPAVGGPDAPSKVIKILRGKVKLEEQAAKKRVLSLNHNGKNYKIGVIDIPAFYLDFEAYHNGDPNYKSTSRDVERLISELKQEKVDGIIIDLRNNGGGSLEEAIKVTGLFIPYGPVVQVRRSDGAVDVNSDDDPDVAYDGPLGVLINRYSASASEIFAGAIQDYKRGLIIGEQSYGKGTVQNLLDLNSYIRFGDQRFGQIKLTIAKFYRITGASTQRKGVIPDLQMPSPIDPEDAGEDTEPSALPWDVIQAADYKLSQKINGQVVSKLIKTHNERLKTEPQLKAYIEEIEKIKENEDKNYVSLKESTRKKERDEIEQIRKKIKDLMSKSPENASDKKPDSQSEDAEETVQASEEEDILLNESGEILADFIRFQR